MCHFSFFLFVFFSRLWLTRAQRDVYPPYGFYVLNRMGMEDYIQHIYPEDDISAHGSYLIIRSYPDYMATRLAGIQAKLELESGTPDKFADVYKIEGIEELDAKRKGRSTIVGLWMFATDARESLIEVMRRSVFTFCLFWCSSWSLTFGLVLKITLVHPEERSLPGRVPIRTR